MKVGRFRSAVIRFLDSLEPNPRARFCEACEYYDFGEGYLSVLDGEGNEKYSYFHVLTARCKKSQRIIQKKRDEPLNIRHPPRWCELCKEDRKRRG